jgi:hypothetical protein
MGYCGLDCVETDLSCSDQITIDQCENGFWVSYDCHQICVDAGYQSSTGCDNGDSDDTCWCSNSPACTPGENQCYGGDLQDCVTSQIWETYNCDQLCVDNGWDFSTSCGYSSNYGDDICFCDYYECTSNSQCPGDCSYGDNYVCCPICNSQYQCEFYCTYF